MYDKFLCKNMGYRASETLSISFYKFCNFFKFIAASMVTGNGSFIPTCCMVLIGGDLWKQPAASLWIPNFCQSTWNKSIGSLQIVVNKPLKVTKTETSHQHICGNLCTFGCVLMFFTISFQIDCFYCVVSPALCYVMRT